MTPGMRRTLVLLAFAAVLTSCASNTAAQGADGHPATADPLAIDAEFPPAMREVSFESDGSKLNGLVYIADGPGPHPTMILLHGYAGNERNLDLAQALRRAGTNVLYFNYRGTWGSGGEFLIAHALEDVKRAVELARDPAWASEYRADPDQVALVGHSFGGFLGALTTAGDKGLACYAHIAGADMGVLGLRARDDTTFRAGLAAVLGKDIDPEGGPVNGNIETVMDDLVAHAEAYSLRSYAAALATRPLFVVAGTRDEAAVKKIHHDPLIAALHEADANRVTEVVYDDDHSFSAHRVDLARRLVDWQQAECWR